MGWSFQPGPYIAKFDGDGYNIGPAGERLAYVDDYEGSKGQAALFAAAPALHVVCLLSLVSSTDHLEYLRSEGFSEKGESIQGLIKLIALQNEALNQADIEIEADG